MKAPVYVSAPVLPPGAGTREVAAKALCQMAVPMVRVEYP